MVCFFVSGKDADSFYFPGYPAFFVSPIQNKSFFDAESLKTNQEKRKVQIETEKGQLSLMPSLYLHTTPKPNEQQSSRVPVPKVVTKTLLINRLHNKVTRGKEMLSGKTRRNFINGRPMGRHLVKRNADAIELPSVFG